MDDLQCGSCNPSSKDISLNAKMAYEQTSTCINTV